MQDLFEKKNFPFRPLTRRHFFESSGGFLGAAIGYLWASEGLIAARLPDAKNNPELERIAPRLPVRINSVIFLFMCGGVSHIDTFDPKDNKFAGKMVEAVGFGDNQAKMQRPVIPILRNYTRYGQSGIAVSDWFPNVGSCVDDIALIRSMYTQEVNHFPAVIEMVTGHRGRQFNHPSIGSWIYYALGTANKNLPVFINMGRPSSPVQLTGGYLGTVYAATPFGTGEVPVENLKSPPSVSASQREKDLSVLSMMNEEFREQYATDMEIAARLKSYELAARMQLSVPELTEFEREPDQVKALYGIGEKETDSFGRQLLLARRLSEKGVRFIQICHGGGGNGLRSGRLGPGGSPADRHPFRGGGGGARPAGPGAARGDSAAAGGCGGTRTVGRGPSAGGGEPGQPGGTRDRSGGLPVDPAALSTGRLGRLRERADPEDGSGPIKRNRVGKGPRWERLTCALRPSAVAMSGCLG